MFAAETEVKNNLYVLLLYLCIIIKYHQNYDVKQKKLVLEKKEKIK